MRRRRRNDGCLAVFTYWLGMVVFGGLGVVVGLQILEWIGATKIVVEHVQKQSGQHE